MPDQRFKNQVAIVTGGGSGIGLAITRKLEHDGATVVVGQRSQANVTNFVKSDLSNTEQCIALIASTVARFGRLDILVNNAGVMQETEIDTLSLEQWNQHLAVNLTAPFVLTREAVPYLKEHGGSIINIGSIEGLGANPGHAAYCASKGGIHALTRATAIDCGKHQIRCNAVAPGWIDTTLNEEFVASMSDPKAFQHKIKAIHPVGRTGAPADVANLVCWLASAEAAFITGQVYTIDGGRMAKLSLPD